LMKSSRSSQHDCPTRATAGNSARSALEGQGAAANCPTACAFGSNWLHSHKVPVSPPPLGPHPAVKTTERFVFHFFKGFFWVLLIAVIVQKGT
jgi:hypothetical protein